MALQERLDAIRAAFEAQAPPEILTQMRRAAAELEASGLRERALKAGARAPDFALPDPQGGVVDSRALRARGPLVLTFYRGVW